MSALFFVLSELRATSSFPTYIIRVSIARRMTDYYRPRQQESRSDLYQANNSSRNQHPPQPAAGPSFASSFLSSSSVSTSNVGNTNANSIKCSDCASWIDLEEMGEHRCSSSSTRGSSGGGQREKQREKERRRPSISIQIDSKSNNRGIDGGGSSSRDALDGSEYKYGPCHTRSR